MKPNFQTLSIKELKKYILQHREDQEAFNAFMNLIANQPPTHLYDEIDVERFSELLSEHQKSQQS